jgi:hypothetical protein
MGLSKVPNNALTRQIFPPKTKSQNGLQKSCSDIYRSKTSRGGGPFFFFLFLFFGFFPNMSIGAKVDFLSDYLEIIRLFY